MLKGVGYMLPLIDIIRECGSILQAGLMCTVSSANQTQCLVLGLHTIKPQSSPTVVCKISMEKI